MNKSWPSCNENWKKLGLLFKLSWFVLINCDDHMSLLLFTFTFVLQSAKTHRFLICFSGKWVKLFLFVSYLQRLFNGRRRFSLRLWWFCFCNNKKKTILARKFKVSYFLCKHIFYSYPSSFDNVCSCFWKCLDSLENKKVGKIWASR